MSNQAKNIEMTSPKMLLRVKKKIVEEPIEEFEPTPNQLTDTDNNQIVTQYNLNDQQLETNNAPPDSHQLDSNNDRPSYSHQMENNYDPSDSQQIPNGYMRITQEPYKINDQEEHPEDAKLRGTNSQGSSKTIIALSVVLVICIVAAIGYFYSGKSNTKTSRKKQSVAIHSSYRSNTTSSNSGSASENKSSVK